MVFRVAALFLRAVRYGLISPHMAFRVLAVLISALALAFVSPTVGWHALHWVALVPVMWAMRDGASRSNRWLAFLFGTASVAILFRWLARTIIIFSNLGAPLAGITLLLFAIVFGLPYLIVWTSIHPLRQRLGSGWILAFPALQVVVEQITMYVFLFPYHQGVSQHRVPVTWQLASVTGVAGLTFVVFLVNAAIAEVLYRRREGRAPPWGWLAGVAAVVAGVVAFGAWRYQRIEAVLAEAPVLRVGVVQTDKTMQQRFSESRRRMLFDWIDATERLIEAHPGEVDLVVWSEGASPGNVHEGAAYDLIADLARRGGFAMVLGGGTDERHQFPVTEDEWAAERARDPELSELQGRTIGDRWFENYNSVYLFESDGRIGGRYDKVIPLPFGEYLPLSKQLPFLRDWIKGPGDFRAGEDVVVLESAKARIATPICYEAILPYLCRRFEEPTLIVNPTNDAWFAEPGPQQHAMLAVGRAVELGVPMVRGAYTGTSMVVEPHGRIVHEVPPFVASEEVVPVRLARIPTIYARYGDWFPLMCALGLGVSIGIGPWLRRQRDLRREARDGRPSPAST
jgi:apolipoprotein N-acyltransferase